MTDDSSEWPVVDSVTEYDTEWYTTGYDRVETPTGHRRKYRWVSQNDGAVVVAVDQGDVLFIKQYRPVVRERHLELPAGMVDEGESFEEAAVRELREETGFTPDEVELLQEYDVAINILRHRRGIVAVEGLTRVDRELDDDEYIDVVRVPVEEAVERAREQPSNDATLTALMLAEREGLL